MPAKLQKRDQSPYRIGLSELEPLPTNAACPQPFDGPAPSLPVSFIQQDSNDSGVSQHSHMDNQSPPDPFHIKGRHGDRSQALCQGIRPIQPLLREPPVHGWEGPLHKRPQVIQRYFIIFPFWGRRNGRASSRKNCTRLLGSSTPAGKCPSNICRTIWDAPLKFTVQSLIAHLLAPR